MPIDSFTVLLFGLFIKVVLGALFVMFWLRNRAAPWFGWWSVSLLLGSVTSVLYMWRGPDSLVSVGIGNATLIAVLRLLLAGRARLRSAAAAVEPRAGCRPCCGSASVSFRNSWRASPYRVALSSGLIAPLLAMSAVSSGAAAPRGCRRAGR